jgi:hypothetical protein
MSVLYNMQDVAKALNVSAQYVHKVYKQNKLPEPKHCVGNSPLWDFEQLIQIITERDVEKYDRSC